MRPHLPHRRQAKCLVEWVEVEVEVQAQVETS